MKEIDPEPDADVRDAISAALVDDPKAVIDAWSRAALREGVEPVSEGE